MGTIDRNFKCATCGEGMAECPGHFGHIELARPVFHVGEWNDDSRCVWLTPSQGFLGKVKKILESICVNCGKLKADTVSVVITLRIHFLGALAARGAGNPEPTVNQKISVVARSMRVFVPSRDPCMSSTVGFWLCGEKESWVKLNGICYSYDWLYRSVSRVAHPFIYFFVLVSLEIYPLRSRISAGSLTGNSHVVPNRCSPTRRSPVKLSRRAITPRLAWQPSGVSVKARRLVRQMKSKRKSKKEGLQLKSRRVMEGVGIINPKFAKKA